MVVVVLQQDHAQSYKTRHNLESVRLSSTDLHPRSPSMSETLSQEEKRHGVQCAALLYTISILCACLIWCGAPNRG